MVNGEECKLSRNGWESSKECIPQNTPYLTSTICTPYSPCISAMDAYVSTCSVAYWLFLIHWLNFPQSSETICPLSTSTLLAYYKFFVKIINIQFLCTGVVRCCCTHIVSKFHDSDSIPCRCVSTLHANNVYYEMREPFNTCNIYIFLSCEYMYYS